jgi:hypothetical protein
MTSTKNTAEPITHENIVLIQFEDWCNVDEDRKDRNRRVRPAGWNSSWDECIRCGRAMNPEKPIYMVHWSEAGNLYPVAVSDEFAAEHDEGDQGWFAIGNECAKHVTAAYKSKK